MFGDRSNLGFDCTCFLFRLKHFRAELCLASKTPWMELIDMKTPQPCAVYAGMPFCVVAPKAISDMEKAREHGLEMENAIPPADKGGASFDKMRFPDKLARMV